MAIKGAKHLSSQHIDWLLSWITNQSDQPSYREVCSALEKRWGIERDPDTIRRRKEIKRVMDAKKTAAKQQPASKSDKPTQRRLNQLSAEVQRLRTQVIQVTAERDELLERNLRYLNAMKVSQVPEQRWERPLAPVNRDPTELPSRNKK